MVFSSHIFLFYFLPLALLLYYAMPRPGKHLLLTLLNYAFYGWTNPLFMGLMLLSTLIDYCAGLLLAYDGWRWRGPIPFLAPGEQRSPRQRRALLISIVANLSLLGFFKYFNFGLANWNWLAEVSGLSGLHLDLIFKVTLPLGISFYTFQSMSYTIDIYRGQAQALKNFVDFACYVSMFPQLVAGPIIRFQDIADQLRQRTYSFEKFGRGVAFMSLGLAKKIMLANPCGKVADVVFGAGTVGAGEAWYGLLAYSFQIYFDFSGYSDMAIGLGLMLGFVFAKNFDSPYKSQSITEFWRRWHLSLSTWLRDNLYFPLGGNRRGPWRTYLNLAIVMLLGGLWHGAAWNFIIWGGIHGFFLACERRLGKQSLYHRLPSAGRVALTFLIVSLGWVFFRAADLTAAGHYLQCMLGLGAVPENAALIKGIIYQPYYLLTLVLAAFITWRMPQTWDWTRSLSVLKVISMILLLIASLMILSTQAYNPFIYFIF
ncbi:MAG: MBOAT family protein [Lentisphaerae bacterium]|nr:MBOAT family protein [Lentisphaerota bacterium]